MCLSIGEYLHRMKNKFDNKMRCINARKDITRKDQTRGRFVGPNSQKLLERLKDRRFKQIFAFLDKDKVLPGLSCNFNFYLHKIVCR